MKLHLNINKIQELYYCLFLNNGAKFLFESTKNKISKSKKCFGVVFCLLPFSGVLKIKVYGLKLPKKELFYDFIVTFSLIWKPTGQKLMKRWFFKIDWESICFVRKPQVTVMEINVKLVNQFRILVSCFSVEFIEGKKFVVCSGNRIAQHD